jgi:molybdopterin-binding protein
MQRAPNKFTGTVKSLTLGDIAAEVVVSVGQLEFSSLIPHSSAKELGLKTGDKVSVLVKSTEVLVDK